MEFEKGQLYHIYNRGNNSDQVFYNRDNYLFFLDKIHIFIKPYCDIIAWTLMPNHFHLMVQVNEVELVASTNTDPFALSERVGKSNLSERVGENKTLEKDEEITDTKYRTLNQSIGIMLRSYTNAIQKQENRTGSLFQGQTKAILLAENQRFVPQWFNTAFGTLINTTEYNSYAETCFHYIHNNAKAAHLVAENEDWEFSSFREYAGLRNGKLINKELGKEFFG